jgi:hypothetical protein
MLDMGKDFSANEGLIGQDLGDLVMGACMKKVRYHQR